MTVLCIQCIYINLPSLPSLSSLPLIPFLIPASFLSISYLLLLLFGLCVCVKAHYIVLGFLVKILDEELFTRARVPRQWLYHRRKMSFPSPGTIHSLEVLKGLGLRSSFPCYHCLPIKCTGKGGEGPQGPPHFHLLPTLFLENPFVLTRIPSMEDTRDTQFLLERSLLFNFLQKPLQESL